MSARANSIWLATITRSVTAQRAFLSAIHQGHSYKTYSLMEGCELPEIHANTELERTMAARRSVRVFSGASISLSELARLLYFTYGRTEAGGIYRAVASGGALYPLELYVVA